MTRLLEIQELLQDTSAALSRLETASVEHPNSYGLRINRKSLMKRYEELKQQFAEAARLATVDVCRYRLFSEGGNPTLLAVTTAVADFQKLLTIVYDAMNNGRKQKSRPTATAVRQTSMGLGYVFPGSVGFALTLPRDQQELSEHDVRAAMKVIAEMVENQSPDSIREYSRWLGPAIVRSAYRWISDHVDYGMGMDVQWESAEPINLFAEQHSLQQLKLLVEQTSEIVEEIEVVTGTYVGGDVDKETVHIKRADQSDVFASFDWDFDRATKHPEYHELCRAVLRKETVVHLSMETEDVRWYLKKLERIS